MIAEAFHAGEREMQQRAGVRDRMAEIGPRVMRDHLPEQHRQFFAQLPFLIAGTVDAEGQPWASVLVNPPGFAHAPDERHLVVQARPLHGDPLQETLVAGASIGLLGIEPHTRRRNRMNGTVDTMAGNGFTVRVQQSFGNCPKYIQPRRARFVDAAGDGQAPVQASDRLDAAARRLIANADAFFIASAYPGAGDDGDRAHGVDVSHRGGPPGFVRIDDERTLTVPDYLGNFFFNTLGNLSANPRAGLLFIDFARGDRLYVAADARILWEGPEVDAVAGAERLLRFTIREVRRVDASLPLVWRDV